MGNVIVDISISLDGFVAGPNDGHGNGLGDGGEPLHNWVAGGDWSHVEGQPFTPSDVDAQVLQDMLAGCGAAVVGRRMYDIADGWGDEPHWGFPVFVVTHRPQQPLTKGSTTFTYVTEGVESGIEQAKAAAGAKHVHIGGGASVIQQALRTGLVDELHLHVAPLVLGAGRPLFEPDGPSFRLEKLGAVETPFASHQRYRMRA